MTRRPDAPTLKGLFYHYRREAKQKWSELAWMLTVFLLYLSKRKR